MNSGIIRVGSRCQNEAIEPFTLMHARKNFREKRLLPRDLHQKKHKLLLNKISAEEALQTNQSYIQESRTIILPIGKFQKYAIISESALSSLMSPYDIPDADAALLDWLSLDYIDQKQFDESPNDVDLSAKCSQLNIDDSTQDPTKSSDMTTTTDNDDKSSKETLDENMSDEQRSAMNDDDEEEEERRRLDLDMDESNFASFSGLKPKLRPENQLKSDRKLVHDNEDGWQVSRRKSNSRAQKIQRLLQYPTTLTDVTVQDLSSNVWQLTIGQRHDLYRYWLMKYAHRCNNDLFDSRMMFNQAAQDLNEYYQEEDYFILKQSVIVAMTTTCAAIYHNTLEKLRKAINTCFSIRSTRNSIVDCSRV
jgi:hypothetical protein